ncbi:MAG: hypothetical protein ACOC8K_06455, partial [Gemmatimonadota bacterium]
MALLTDQYELTMLQAYWREEMFDTSVFSLFVRRLPPGRNYLLACGLDDVLDYLESLHFTDTALEYLGTFDEFTDGFLEWLADLRFTGDVYAVPEGTPVFPDEPLLEVEAPLPEAQLAETYIMNQVHLQTVLADALQRCRHNLFIATANVKDLHLPPPGRRAGRSRSILQAFRALS